MTDPLGAAEVAHPDGDRAQGHARPGDGVDLRVDRAGAEQLADGRDVQKRPGKHDLEDHTEDQEAVPERLSVEARAVARAAAEQFAEDSGADVGSIRKATQGYFSIDARDGEAGGWGIGDTPFKKVRVVTTVDFALD